MLLHDFLSYREAKPSATFLSETNKRHEEFVAYGLGYAWPIVFEADLEALWRFAKDHFDSARIERNSLAGVYQQIVEYALELLRVELEPAFAAAIAANRNGNTFKFRPSVT